MCQLSYSSQTSLGERYRASRKQHALGEADDEGFASEEIMRRIDIEYPDTGTAWVRSCFFGRPALTFMTADRACDRLSENRLARRQPGSLADFCVLGFCIEVCVLARVEMIQKIGACVTPVCRGILKIVLT